MSVESQSGSRGRRIVSGAVLSVAVFVLGTLTLEVALRALGYQPRPRPSHDGPPYTIETDDRLILPDEAAGYRYGPGEFVVQFKTGHRFHLRHGPDGLRCTRPLSSTSGDSLPQIWMMGGSFTHGWSVDDEDTFPWKVQEALPAFDVRNFGVGGYGTLQSWLRFVSTLAAGEKPAAVVLVYASFADGRNTWTRSWARSLHPTKRELAEGIPRAVFSEEHGFEVVRDRPRYRPFPLVHHSALTTALEARFDRLEDRLLRHSREVNLAIVQAFQRRCQQDGIVFVLAGILRDRGTRWTLDQARRSGIDTVDISADLSREGYRNRPHDGHPSRLAHAVYAERLIPRLRSVLQLDDEAGLADAQR